MQIIALNGSPRKENSTTKKLVDEVLFGVRTAGAETSYIDLCQYTIGYCTGCGSCYISGNCVIDDDYPEILKRILSADGIVFASPNYINQVTAQVKTFLDRSADAIHCQRFSGMYGCSVSTAGGSGALEVAAYLNRTLGILGADTVGGVGVVMAEGEEAWNRAVQEARKLGKDLVDAIQVRRKFPEQEAVHHEMHERMKALILSNKDVWKHEYRYWQDKGWL
ncbi:MAG: flavodoxin family protein [Methanospirillaceae archaeon]|nr:flavodoxin family protein [Methanospirillaceae archaeon]